MRFAKLLPPLALVGALALIPTATSGLAAADTDTYKELETFMSVFQRVRSQYVDKVDDHVLIKGAIDGMLAALDPHSAYAEGADYQQTKATTDGNYGGLGITVSTEDGAVKIVAPTEDTPAWRAGLKAGDYITHLDGVLLYGSTLDEAVEKMRGDAGTKIKLTIVRPGRDKPFDVSLVREKIQLRPVKWEIRDQIGYININGFSAQTGAATESALKSIDAATGGRPLGYVVDLRSNPGGLLDQAVSVSDAFLDHGEIVSERGREKTDIDRFYAHPGDLAHGLPVIVLVDAGTASAAEIVAGALQDQRRAIVMGERSFGKGSVQSLFFLDRARTSAVKITTARYYTPLGRSVQEGGIFPDIRVPQLSDPDARRRAEMSVRESDLRRHLVNEAGLDDKKLETDRQDDPRFRMTPDEIKAKGIKDYQLFYAVQTVHRTAAAGKRR